MSLHMLKKSTRAGLWMVWLGLCLFPSVSWGQFVTQWKMARDSKMYTFSSPMPYHGHPDAYQQGPSIPAYPSAVWTDAPDVRDVKFREKSRHCGTKHECLRAGFYNFYRAEVHFPTAYQLTSLKLRLWAVDDGLKLTIFNAKYPKGVSPKEGFVTLVDMRKTGPEKGSQVTGELRSYFVVNGPNTIVITHLDDCCASMVLDRVEVLVNGQRAKTNGVPEILSLAKPYAIPQQQYIYKMHVVDVEKSALQYKLLRGPQGASMNNATGRMTWTPAQSELGTSHECIVQVCDPDSGCAIQSWTLKVKAQSTNHKPEFISIPKYFVRFDRTFTYTPEIRDIDKWDQHATTFAFRQAPKDATIDPKTGKVEWKPGKIGEWSPFAVEACDLEGLCALQVWTVTVRDVRKPVFASTPPTEVFVNGNIEYIPALWNPEPNATYTWRLLSGPNLYFRPSDGRMRWYGIPEHLAGNSVAFGLEVCLYKRCTQQRWSVALKVEPGFGGANFTTSPSGYAVVGKWFTYKPNLSPIGRTRSLQWTSLPQGAIIKDGELRWLPQTSHIGTKQPIEFQACFNDNACLKQSWDLEVLPPNRPPSMTSTPPLRVRAGRKYGYQMTFTEPDAFDEYHYFAIEKGPSNIILNPMTGDMTWTPGDADVGEVPVTAKICDLKGACDLQSWKIKVDPFPFSLDSIPPGAGTIQQTYAYQPTIKWASGNPLSGQWKLLEGPTGASINGAKGNVEWLPGAQAAGKQFAFAISFCVEREGCREQRWSIKVNGLTPIPPPQFESQPETNASAGELYTYNVKLRDAQDEAKFTLKEGSDGAKLSGSTLTWTPTSQEAGSDVRFVLEACTKGSCALQSWQVRVKATQVTPTPGTRCKSASDCPNNQSCTSGRCQPAGVKQDTPPEGQKSIGDQNQKKDEVPPVAVGCQCNANQDKPKHIDIGLLLALLCLGTLWLRNQREQQER